MIGDFWNDLPWLGRIVFVMLAITLIADAFFVAWLVNR